MLVLPSVLRNEHKFEEYMKKSEDTYEWKRNYIKERFKYEFFSYMNRKPMENILVYDRPFYDKDAILKYSFNKKELLDEIIQENPEIFEQEFYKKYL